VRRYLLDTTPLTAYLLNRPVAVELIRPWIRQREAATSILVYAEVVEYIKAFPNFPERQAQLRDLLSEITPYFLTYTILERYADIRRHLRPPRRPGLIGDIDTLIAATALERNLTVVTVDEDFQRVPDLEVLLISRDHLSRR
jgi:predicted nucleic acid-binding protein